MILAGTGHRPEKCAAENVVRRAIRNVLKEIRPAVAITGMAAGFDLWLGDEALLLGIEVWAAKPWAGHGPLKGDEQLYARVLAGAGKIVNVVERDEFPGNWCYQRRNEWMVDHADHILAYYDGSRGGTANCINYANKVRKPVTNIYDR